MIQNGKIVVTTRGLSWALIAVSAGNTACLIDAMRTINKMRKLIDAHKKYQKYLEAMAGGLEIIAVNPKADPIENRQAVEDLMIKIKGDMILDGVDIEAELEKLK